MKFTNTHTLYADLILPIALPHHFLTYGVPLEFHNSIEEGMRVEVALGKNKRYSAIVARLHQDKPLNYEIKPIISILDEHPLVNPLQLKFWFWVARYYIATLGEVMQAALPAFLKLSAETTLIINQKTQLNETDLSEHALQFWQLLTQKKEIKISDIKQIVGYRNVALVIRELLQQNAVFIQDQLESNYQPKTEKIVELTPEYHEEEKLHDLMNLLERAPKQLQVILAFLDLSMKGQIVKRDALLNKLKEAAAPLKTLVDKGILLLSEQVIDRFKMDDSSEKKTLLLSTVQQTAYNAIENAWKEKEVVLLHGVTGSGKTEIYIQLIQNCIQQGKQALLLLPEIGLTTQLVRRLYAYFGDQLGVYHSRFSNNERVEIWEKVQNFQYQIIIGARSALWLPFDHLGLIIVDEEHDTSFKQREPAPRFHARDAAIYLAHLHQAKIVLGSATPSVESIYNCQINKYALVTLKERYKNVALPEVSIIAAQSLETVKKQGIFLLTPELIEAMKDALLQKKQIILFQNRRGYAPFQICTSCGWVPQCDNCSVALTYHKNSDKMHCHYCGFSISPPNHCIACGSIKMVSKSFGTEKIEEEVKMVFPDAQVARMDIDSMRGKQNLAILLDQMEQQQIDILVGTQMVVKGLDFAPVALVAILNADSLLSYPDFRVNERAFQLMEQVSGRAGRADGNGKVIIQAYNGNHPVLEWVKNHDDQPFYEQEIAFRKEFLYPPFVRLIVAVCKHQDEIKAHEAATNLAEKIRQMESIIVQGPVPATVVRVRNKYVQEVWIKCPKNAQILEAVKQNLQHIKQNVLSEKNLKGVQIYFDVDSV